MARKYERIEGIHEIFERFVGGWRFVKLYVGNEERMTSEVVYDFKAYYMWIVDKAALEGTDKVIPNCWALMMKDDEMGPGVHVDG